MTQRESDPPRQSVQIERRFSQLLQRRPLHLAADAAESVACHLVGGALRDAALGMEFRDLDLVIERDGLSFARRLAAKLPARLVELGGDRFAAYRLVAEGLTLDIWDRQGAPLEADLNRRDLTIHSLAVELPGGTVVDPFHGLVDLEDHTLRATSETSFSTDPLRVLRLARFAGQLPGFTVTEHTLELAIGSAVDLERVAGERIRVELERLLALPDFLSAAELLIQLRLYPGLWQSQPGQGASGRHAEELMIRLRHLELFADHSRDRVERAAARQALLFANLPMSAEQTARGVVDGCLREGLLTKASAKRLERLLHFEGLPRDTAGQRWFLHRNGDLWPTAACFLAATQERSCSLLEYQENLTRLEALCRKSGKEIFEPEPLITGTDLVYHLGLPTGRALGQILATLKRRQVEGGLSTRAEALELAAKLVHESTAEAD